jgi:hypothetical protein
MKWCRTGALATCLLFTIAARAQEPPPPGQPADPGADAREPPTTDEAPAAEPPQTPPAVAPPEPTRAKAHDAAPAGPKSPVLVGLGTGAVAIGVTGLIIGGILLPIGLVLDEENTCKNKSGSLTFDCEYGTAGDMVPAGAIALGAGAALLVGGIVMIAVGKEPAKSATRGGFRWAF